MKTIRDAIHGDITFNDLEMAVIDTPVFQRLRGVKQLGASSLVFPSATHTRFEHSLGACWMAKRMLRSIEAGAGPLPAVDRQTIVLSALLHDITHVPFGHTFEDERRLFERHDEDDSRLAYFLDSPELAPVLARCEAPTLLRETLAGKASDRPFLRQLVAGAVGADLLDYLKRDAYFCGLNLAYDDRLLLYFSLLNDGLVVRLHKSGEFRRDAISELVHLLQIRYALTERVYYHHAKVVAGAMISRALELALDAGVLTKTDLYGLRDDSLLDRFQAPARSAPGLQDLGDDLQGRQLYKRVYFLTVAAFGRPGVTDAKRDQLARDFHFNTAHRRRTEQQLADALGTPESHLIIYCPSPKMQLKEADVPVEVVPGVAQPLSSLGHPDVEALKEKHRGLWRLYVLMRRSDTALHAKAAKLCEPIFGEPNQLEIQKTGQLAFGG